jgi:hypothetical protein
MLACTSDREGKYDRFSLLAAAERATPLVPSSLGPSGAERWMAERDAGHLACRASPAHGRPLGR